MTWSVLELFFFWTKPFFPQSYEIQSTNKFYTPMKFCSNGYFSATDQSPAPTKSFKLVNAKYWGNSNELNSLTDLVRYVSVFVKFIKGATSGRPWAHWNGWSQIEIFFNNDEQTFSDSLSPNFMAPVINRTSKYLNRVQREHRYLKGIR